MAAIMMFLSFKILVFFWKRLELEQTLIHEWYNHDKLTSSRFLYITFLYIYGWIGDHLVLFNLQNATFMWASVLISLWYLDWFRCIHLNVIHYLQDGGHLHLFCSESLIWFQDYFTDGYAAWDIENPKSTDFSRKMNDWLRGKS